MSFPSREEEQALHERMLQGDRVASADVFRSYMDPIRQIVQRELRCSWEEARDSTIDAVLSYVQHPDRYDPARAPLSTYLIRAAKNRGRDRHRSRKAEARREQEYADVFELQARTPKETLEVSVEARLALERIEQSTLGEKERGVLRLILHGERSTRTLAEALGLAPLPEDELRREVKRHRDRLMKWLERLGEEGPDVSS